MTTHALSSSPYSFKHVGSFCIIFFLAVFRPSTIWPEVPVSTAPLAVLSAWLLLLYKVHKTVGYRAFLTQHKTLVLLIGGYFLLCGASLIANYHRYPDLASFLRWGLTFPIIQSALVACGFLFTLPQNINGSSVTRRLDSKLIVFAISAAIPTMTFWQIVDNEGAFQVYQYTIAADMGAQGHTIRSVLATSTDLGSISAILGVAALSILIKQVHTRNWLWATGALLIFVLNTVSGTLSGSRGFFLAFGLGLLACMHQLVGGRLKSSLRSAVPLLLIGLLALQTVPVNTYRTFEGLSPVLAPLALGIPPAKEDLLNSVSGALGERASLWNRATEEILAQPWFGISNGGYRLLNESRGESVINNVHNVILQLGVDAGVGGLLFGVCIICILMRITAGKLQAPVFVTIAAGLMVDNFADHSLSWIAIAAYAMASCTPVMPRLLTNTRAAPKLVTSLTLSSFVLLIVLISQHHQKQAAFNSMTLAEQISQAASYIFLDYWKKPPVMMSSALSMELDEVTLHDQLTLYPRIAVSDYCAYSYPGSKLLYLPSEQLATNVRRYRSLNDHWRFTSAQPEGCDYRAKNPAQISNWISNHHRSYGERLRQPNATMRLNTDYIKFFSPIFEVSAYQKLTFNLSSKDLESVSPTLVVYFYDAHTGTELSRVARIAEIGMSQIEFQVPPAPSGAGFLKLNLEDWRHDSGKNLRQQIDINNISLTPQ